MLVGLGDYASVSFLFIVPFFSFANSIVKKVSLEIKILNDWKMEMFFLLVTTFFCLTRFSYYSCLAALSFRAKKKHRKNNVWNRMIQSSFLSYGYYDIKITSSFLFFLNQIYNSKTYRLWTVCLGYESSFISP